MSAEAHDNIILQPENSFTSTTAPGMIFISRDQLSQHYKSDWHKYNLKRREANLPMLSLPDFEARLEAAIALRKEKEDKKHSSGKDHLKSRARGKNEKKHNISGSCQTQQDRIENIGETTDRDDLKALDRNDCEKERSEKCHSIVKFEDHDTRMIDPAICVFDGHMSSSVEENVQYMYEKYGFFLPDREYLFDLEGLLGYCAEKVQLGHVCLYCQKAFSTASACQAHMISTRHTFLKYEAGIDLDEYEVFYDFSKDNEDFWKSVGATKRTAHKKNTRISTDTSRVGMHGYSSNEVMDMDMDKNNENEDEWEDTDEEENFDDENEMYETFEEEIAKLGFNVTSLGELIFPSGKIIGHRALIRYYRQRCTTNKDSVAVIAAKKARAERLYHGHLYRIATSSNEVRDKSDPSSLVVAKSGYTMASLLGRAGHGILVPLNNKAINANSSVGLDERFNFTALSLYRFRAAVKKARRDEFRSKRLQHRTTLPINKMDKKANRLFNNISIAHCRD